MFADGKEGLSSEAVEDINVALLGDLGESVDRLAISPKGEKTGLRWKISVPDVVVNALKMPQEPAGIGIKSEERVCVEVVTEAVAAIEVHDGGTGRHIDYAVSCVK